jgi:hypothetical protein
MDDWTALELVMVGVCLVLVLIPLAFDPALRLKEWLEYRRLRRAQERNHHVD